jgi:hypothetical protein
MKEMVTPKTWAEFRSSGLLWWVNRTLHLLGWAIVVEVDNAGQVTAAYPARVRFRGFDSKSEIEGFKTLSEYMGRHHAELLEEASE